MAVLFLGGAGLIASGLYMLAQFGRGELMPAGAMLCLGAALLLACAVIFIRDLLDSR